MKRMNKKGQFSIIAALLVAVVLVAAVVTTYSTIRYGSSQEQPQILSATDETNQALKQVLGFTVGYYGSILQVTGNSSYAQSLAATYLDSGLQNIAQMRPNWASTFNVTNLNVGTKWFSNSSYSYGQFSITYNLPGLGVYGINYNASCRLDVQVTKSLAANQVTVNVVQDGNQPLINLGRQNFNFYNYTYSNSTWQLSNPLADPAAFANGTYVITVPSGVDPESCLFQVKDARGIIVVGATFNRYVSTFTWNQTSPAGGAFVNTYNSQVDESSDIGTHNSFSSQQNGPDVNFDTMTEASQGTIQQNYTVYPNGVFNLLGSTYVASGTIDKMQYDDGNTMNFGSYGTLPAAQTLYAHQETTNVGGTAFLLSTSNPDQTGMSLSTPMSSSRILLGRSLYSLQGLSNIPAGTWTMNYRTWKDAAVNPTLTNSPSTNAGAWTSGQNAYSSGSGYASSPSNGQAQVYGGYGFSIPSGATVTSVRVRMDAYCMDNDKIKLEVSSNAGSSYINNNYQPTLTTTPQTFWVDITGWTFWTPAKISTDQIYTRVTHVKSGGGDEVRLDWLPIEVTYRTTDATGNISANIMIIKSDGSTRNLIANDVANSPALTTSPLTNQGSYSWAAYSVVSPSDLLEIDYYLDVSTLGSVNGYLRIDDQALGSSSTNVAGISLPTQYTSQVEFTGSSDTNVWNNLVWTVDSSATSSGVNSVLQLYNYITSQYPTSGDGRITATLGTTSQIVTQTMATNPAFFRDGSGAWKVQFTATKTTTVPFNINLDLLRLSPTENSYALRLEEQWVNVNFTIPGQDLCIYAGNLASENLLVDVWHGGTWNSVYGTGLIPGWNNVSVSQFVDSSTFTIRYRDSLTGVDNSQSSWGIDAALLCYQPDLHLLQSVQNGPVIIELLQNGTMRWLGQNLQMTTQSKPVPPLPVKSLHFNQTLNGVNSEAAFQIEDWASQYQIPLGLTNNFTVFGNRQMIVFPVNANVSKVTIWWDGSDSATQTRYAFTNTYFTGDDPSNARLTNGRLSLQFTSGFKITSTVGTSSSTTTFMRANNVASTYGASPAYVIHHGVVRDVVQQEAEWSNGIPNCPNIYAQIVITFPAGATYFTYQTRMMFINSAQARTISDLCPVDVVSSAATETMTEDGTLADLPIVSNLTGTYYNYNGNTEHHWSQFISGSRGAGIMFNDQANQQLYTFDTPSQYTGSLNVSNTISLLPVSPRYQVQFTNARDITWSGAVATFDASATPIYNLLPNGNPTGLWIIVEYQPSIAVVSET